MNRTLSLLRVAGEVGCLLGQSRLLILRKRPFEMGRRSSRFKVDSKLLAALTTGLDLANLWRSAEVLSFVQIRPIPLKDPLIASPHLLRSLGPAVFIDGGCLRGSVMAAASLPARQKAVSFSTI